MKSFLIPSFSLFVITLGFFGCTDPINPGTVSAVATAPTSSELETPGTVIAFNPKITVRGVSSCDYDNSVNTVSDLPATAGPVECNMTITDDGSTIVVTLENSTLFGTDNLVLSLTGFTDKGGDGYTDEFSVSATKGTTTVAATGQFVGEQKPRNKNVSDAEKVNILGAPTAAEWSSYIIGNMIFAQDDDGDGNLLTFSSSTAEWRGVGGEDDGETSILENYTYEQISETEGMLIIKDEWTEEDGSKWYGKTEFKLTFINFYTGTWVETSDYEINLTTNQESQTSLGSGTFDVYTDASLLVSGQ